MYVMKCRKCGAKCRREDIEMTVPGEGSAGNTMIDIVIYCPNDDCDWKAFRMLEAEDFIDFPEGE